MFQKRRNVHGYGICIDITQPSAINTSPISKRHFDAACSNSMRCLGACATGCLDPELSSAMTRGYPALGSSGFIPGSCVTLEVVVTLLFDPDARIDVSQLRSRLSSSTAMLRCRPI